MILFACLISCKNPPSDRNTNSSTEPSSIEGDKNESTFHSFFDKFSTDSVFQISHVMFPLTFRYRDAYEEGKEITIQQDQESWRFIPFKEDAESPLFRGEFDIGEVTAVYRRKGLDTGIYIEYFFKNESGKWFLVSYSDFSN